MKLTNISKITADFLKEKIDFLIDGDKLSDWITSEHIYDIDLPHQLPSKQAFIVVTPSNSQDPIDLQSQNTLAVPVDINVQVFYKIISSASITVKESGSIEQRRAENVAYRACLDMSDLVGKLVNMSNDFNGKISNNRQKIPTERGRSENAELNQILFMLYNTIIKVVVTSKIETTI